MTVPATFLDVSGVRFRAVYDVLGGLSEALPRAEAIAVEQTIEFPADLVADDDIRGQLIGRIEHAEEIGDVEPSDAAFRSPGPRTRIAISYAIETSGGELPQLLNVLFGNCSLLPGVRLVDVEFPPELAAVLPGPRFGTPGLRDLLGVPARPLLATALKPMGLGADALAAIAETLAVGGIDLIKDDHSLANQPFAPFAERVGACAAAVARANESTGGRSLYLPALNGPADELAARARFARDAGAGGLLVMPGLVGFDSVRWLAQSDEIGLPIMVHPALLGAFVATEDGGAEHGLLFGTLARLIGGDLSIFPSYGGRFSFSPDACASIARAAREPLGDRRPMIPVPAGGMTVDRIPELVAFYGSDIALLIGGDLHRGDLLTNARRMREAAEAAGCATIEECV